MLERICPQCGAANASQQRRCGTCGGLMEQPLQRRAPTALSQRASRLPARWQQTRRVVALGLLTVAAEAGVQWLQRRQHPNAAPVRSQDRVVALQQRIIERWNGGQLQERTIERTVWLEPNRTKH